MERVYRALDRERQEKRRAEIEAGLFWPRSATGRIQVVTEVDEW